MSSRKNNHSTKVSNYIKYESNLNMNGIEYPVKIKDIHGLKHKTQL